MMPPIQRRTLLAAPLLGWTALPGSLAQPARPLARVGWLGWGADVTAAPGVPLQAFRAGLRDKGWVEGQNLVLEVRGSDDRSQLPTLTEALVRVGVQVIAVQGANVFSARSAAKSTPLLFAINGDPVEAGLVQSLANPGGTLTGVTALSAELSGKRLELLHGVRPGITRLTLLANAAHPGVQTELDASHAAAQRLGVTLRYVPVRGASDFEAAFEAIAGQDTQGIVAIPDNLINLMATSIGDFAARRRLPSISGWAEFAEAGNLLSYGPDLRGFYRQLADYADRLLRGAMPADLPVVQPTRLRLVLNLRVARQLGITPPPALRLRADEVIE